MRFSKKLERRMRSFQIHRNAKFMTSMANRVSKMEAVVVLASAVPISSKALVENVKEDSVSSKPTRSSDSSLEAETPSPTFSMTASLAWGEEATKVAKDKPSQRGEIHLEGSECSMKKMIFSEAALVVALEVRACLVK